MVRVVCDFCGVEFDRRPSKIRKLNFHCRDCRLAYFKENGRSKYDYSAQNRILNAAKKRGVVD